MGWWQWDGGEEGPYWVIRALAAEHGLLRPRDVECAGVHRRRLDLLAAVGGLQRIGRGLFALPQADCGPLAQAAKRAPRAIVCLRSALWVHGLLEDEPPEVWLCIDRRARKPRFATPPTRIVRASGSALAAGAEEYTCGKVPLRVYGVAKTVADCFRFRRIVGPELGPRMLLRALREGRCTLRHLELCATICRTSRVMGPYLKGAKLLSGR